MPSIGIIGLGRFGTFAKEKLSEDFPVVVHDPYKGVGSLNEVCNCDIIIPCVPIRTFKDLMNNIKGLVRDESIVLDICSVKGHSLECMKKLNCQYLATHPMFGPQSAQSGLQGKKLVVCGGNMSEESQGALLSYAQSKGIEIIHMTADEHDKVVAHTQVLAHFVGRSLEKCGVESGPIDTHGFELLCEVKDLADNNSKELFEDMIKYNPHAQHAIQEYLEKSQSLVVKK